MTKEKLLDLPRLAKQCIVIFLDIIFCVLTTWASIWLQLNEWSTLEGRLWWVMILTVGLSIPLFIIFGLYRAIFRYVGSTALAAIAKIFLIYGFIFLFIVTVVGIEGVPRSIGVVQPILLFLSVGASRYFIRYWLTGVASIRVKHYKYPATAFIFGAGSIGRQIAAGLSDTKDILLKGYIDDDSKLHGRILNGLPVYASNDLQAQILKFGITDILLALPSSAKLRTKAIIEELSGLGVRIRNPPRFKDFFDRRIGLSNLDDLDADDLLGREVVPPNMALLKKNITNKNILVTGAGGSIGSELCRQIFKLSPKSLTLVENNEHSLYQIYEELKLLDSQKFERLDLAADDASYFRENSSIKIYPYLASVRDRKLIFRIFLDHQPESVFHAAAYKHVPLAEKNSVECIKNNVLGTLNCAQASLDVGVASFVLISTDKAVRPTNVMGASKRISEMLLEAMEELAKARGSATLFSMVRFGNVLDSSGSVVPLFRTQIKMGGPITLTHPKVTRYFMTIPEAAQLVIQSGAMSVGGDVFLLDMGKPVRIYDLATKMIHLSGLIVKDELHADGDIEIKIIGLRPGEKLYEELLIENNPKPTCHKKIFKSSEKSISWDELEPMLNELYMILETGDINLIQAKLMQIVQGYQPKF